ncbi:MarR family winged helix-turn-helix transcriptional regulator [Minwuia sp.]|uniref:MarR family winged helix-turn-helix transcriptional regulator n=1 Tax=Minwuia sp. TaxID=2493630 RepID=UPI003A8D3946
MVDDAAGRPGFGEAGPRVAELIDRLGRLTRELQYVDGLNPAQWEALRFLSRANRYSRTPGAVAQFLCATKGTVSQTITALENKGLLTRRPSDRDKRVCLIDLTPQGESLILRDPVKRIEQAVATMDGDASAAMVQGLSRLLAAVQDNKDAPLFGVCAACCRHIPRGSGCGEAADTARCGITGEPLSTDETRRVCVNYSNG